MVNYRCADRVRGEHALSIVERLHSRQACALPSESSGEPLFEALSGVCSEKDGRDSLRVRPDTAS